MNEEFYNDKTGKKVEATIVPVGPRTYINLKEVGNGWLDIDVDCFALIVSFAMKRGMLNITQEERMVPKIETLIGSGYLQNPDW